jgi:hypothetical protein
MNFWRALMEENGMELENGYLISVVLRSLPIECTKSRSYLKHLLEDVVNRETVSFVAVRMALPSSRAFDVELIESRLRNVCLEFCVCVKDYLGRLYFWRRMLKEHNKDISDSDFLGIMIDGLSPEYQRIGARYDILRSTPAFDKEMLDEFASRLRVLERDIAWFESHPSLNSMAFFVEELFNRRDPANVMQLDWRIRAYFGLTLMSLFISALEYWVLNQPLRDTMESTSIQICALSILVIWRHLYLHFRLKDVFSRVVGWALLVVCTAGLNYSDPSFPFNLLSLLVKVVLPLVVYHGLVVEVARGRLKGYRSGKANA